MPTDGKAQAMLSSMAATFDTAAKAETQATLAKSSKWVISGSTVAEVRAQMRKLFNTSGANTNDVLRKFDVDAGGRAALIDRNEFENAMRREFRYGGPRAVSAHSAAPALGSVPRVVLPRPLYTVASTLCVRVCVTGNRRALRGAR